jgi:hypothetical protein
MNPEQSEGDLFFELGRNKPMVGADSAVSCTKRDTTSRAMADKETVERVTRPVKSQGVANYGCQRNVIDRESCVIHHCIREFRITNGQPANLGEKLYLQEGNRRDTPRAVSIQPREFGKSSRSQDKPDQKVSVEKKGHRLERRSETRPRSGPCHSHDHRSAFPAFGTWRSRLYCREPLVFRDLVAFSRRSTRRCPLRSTAITSPRMASSRRRNHCFLASDAVTFFMCTTYKTPWPRVKADLPYGSRKRKIG